MAKANGLGAALLIDGVDLSGDIQQVDNISCPVNALDVTGINKSAHERILGLRDGALSMTTFFNTAEGQAHPTLSTLPTDDVVVSYLHRQTAGAPAANLVAKQINYDGSRAADAGFTFSVQAQANAYGLEWAELLTAGIRTDTEATEGSSYDFGADQLGNFNAQAYLHVTEFTGTDITISLQSSADDAASDPFSERLTFTEVTSGPTAERKTMTAPSTQLIERYVRVVTTTTGGFTSCSFVVSLATNQVEVTF
ncbi:hypothetical protein [Streptomyces sp. NPDC056405]|uniref:hypothetical protein n=1 Tax=Streptomyces sp. NPDC056405 TaxID=3345811 RepID=UPI0035DA28EB